MGWTNEALRRIRFGYNPGDRKPNVWRGEGNVCLCMPPRGGKQTTVIAPIGLTYPGSLICSCPRFQAPSIFGGHRYCNMKQECFIIEPFEDFKEWSNGLPYVGFNPMQGLDPDDLAFIEKCDRLAGALFISHGSGDDNAAHFREAALSAVSGGIGGVVMLYPEKDRNLVTVYDVLVNPTRCSVFVEECLATKNDFLISRLAYLASEAARSGANREVDGIFSTIRTQLRFLSGGAIRKCLSDSRSIRLREFKTGSPATLFYTVKLGYEDTAEKTSRLLFSTLLNEMEAPHPDPVPVLSSWDEYRHTLSRYSLATASLSYSAGMGLAQLCAWQDTPQMVGATTASSWQTLLGTCAVKVFSRPSENFTSDWLSDALGDTEVIVTSKNVGYDAGANWDRAGDMRIHVSEDRHQATRRLMASQELRQMPNSQMIILSDDLPFPALADRIPYYDAPEFEGLYGPDPTYPPSFNVKGPQPRWARGKTFLFGSGHKG
jgi:type IV secretory pathway TraG/TraD family ATPase VirD4